MPQRWDAARAASQRRTREYKPVGPVGPTIEVLPDQVGARVNGVALSYKEVFALGVDVPELGISAHGPYGKRGDGLVQCDGCGYHVCSCERQVPGLDFPACEQCARRVGEHVLRDGLCAACGGGALEYTTPVGRLKIIADPRMSQSSPPMFLPRTLQGRMSILEGLNELGAISESSRQQAINLLLTGEWEQKQ